MILVDANVLLYAYDARSPHHERCRAWVETAFSGDEPICVSWVTVLAFLRISTNPRIFPRPLRTEEALAVVTSWLARPAVSVLDAGERCWEVFKQAVTEARASGPLLMDAFLAALALENGATLVTTDADFRRFTKLKLHDPTR
ncbi:MAG: type II toxin-antitoxin system VapC family toxin [Vicinamibacteria bacterium]